MNTMPLVSVIIPTYNRGYLIEKTIRSVLNQTYTNLELIVVDDASIDDTECKLSSISDSRLKYIRLSENTNGTRPRNLGIEMSSGEYIAFLDSDDEWQEDKIEKQLEFIGDSISNDFICFTNVIKNNGKENLEIKQMHYDNKEDIMDYILIGGNIVQTSTYLLPAEIAKEIKFNPLLKKHQDWDFCIRLKNRKIKFLHLTQPLTIWNVDSREDRITTNNKFDNSISWYNDIKQCLTKRAQYAFLAKIVNTHYLLNNKKFAAFKIYLEAYYHKSIKIDTCIKGLLKVLIPTFFIRKYYSN
ncbi:glycosyltransferase family 2 protein [Metabacillus idriensis]|uniref:glycosyltransferase family 2 protein n=1 Tax=Metabacillus idriensis TaxID=324768 RepID=UPI0020415052|nr:glycosyltransferase family 2 protein [Metabacillus idriensis]MCM3597512.1 glycosyltransferase family 2 protein [Metabacillus idriensis]